MKGLKNVLYRNLKQHNVDERYLYYHPTCISYDLKTQYISGLYIGVMSYKTFYFKGYKL